MEIKAVVKQHLALVTGQGQKGEWKKQDVIVTYKSGEYEKFLAITLWGDMVNKKPNIGTEAVFHCNVESREWEGRWYTDVKAWKIDGYSTPKQHPKQSAPAQSNSTDEEDNLPF